MHANLISLFRRTTLLVGATLFLSTPPAFAATANNNSDELPRFDSYIKVSGYAPSVSGNEAAFQKRTQRNADGGIGIEDLRIVKDVDKETSLEIDGRAMFGSEDYLGDFKLTREKVGTFATGYKRFRTFYDGIGGFFPLNGYWAPLNPEALAVDRGHFWAEGKLALKDSPVFTLRYTNDTRSGQKDSTIWGDSNLTGLPTVPSNNATRKINPALLDLDERREIIEGRMDYAVGQTKYNLSLLSDQVKNLDTLTLYRYKGEVTPNPERVVQQRNGLESDSWLASFNSDTTLNPKMNLIFGLSYRELDTTLSGERPNAVGVLGSYDFKDLAGGSSMEVWTANAALVCQPSPVWQVITALRWEDNYTKSAGTFTRVAQTAVTVPPTLTYYTIGSRVKEEILTPDLSFRYTGIRKLVLYGAFSDRLTDGDDRKVNPFNTPTPAPTAYGYDDVEQNQAHYKLGANLNSSGALILRGEVFVKDHENKFTGYANQLGNRYVVGYQFTGVKLTAIFKPVPELSFSTRYQPQWGEMQVTTESTPEFQSMDAESHLISETINWNPNRLIYVQAAVNVAFNVISSAYPSSANPNQRNSDNNYWTGSVLTGFVLTRETNAQIEFTYQEADNFEPALAAFSQPYGASYRDYTVAVGVKHKFSDRWIGSAKVGYIESRNDTTGGHTNFKGPLAYVGLEYGL